MVKNRIRYALLFLFFGLAYIFSNSYFLLLLVVGAAVLPVFSLLFLLLFGRKTVLKVQQETSGNSGDGNAAGIYYVLTNGRKSDIDGNLPGGWAYDFLRFPCAARWDAVIENHMTGGRARQRILGSVKGQGEVQIPLDLGTMGTGKRILYTEKLKALDFLGIFSLPLAEPKEAEFYIYPKILPVRLTLDERVETWGDGLSYSQIKAGSDVNEIFSLHEYRYGDDVRRVHWKLSTKTNALMVRDYGLPLNHPVTLLLEMADGSEDVLSTLLDVSVSLSAALLQRGIFHSMAWLDGEGQIFRLEEILSLEDLQLFIPELLETRAWGKGGPALERFLAEGLFSSILYYVTGSREEGLLARASASCYLQTVFIGNRECSDAGRNADDGVDAFAEGNVVYIAPGIKEWEELVI